MSNCIKCNICNSVTEPFAVALLIGKHHCSYYRCTSCGFMQTEEPYWLQEAYSLAITVSDVGMVKRNADMAAISKVVITTFFNSNGKFVDYAGGYALFVRLMRDAGYDFFWNDKYCENLFAKGFVAPEPGSIPVELLTAFEVFEHLIDPVSEVEKMLAYSRNILFTTQLLPEPAPKPDKCWYYGLDHGQHISFFTRSSLECLAERFNLHFYSNGSSMHILTEKRISSKLFSYLSLYKTAKFLAPLIRRASLLPNDYRQSCGVTL